MALPVTITGIATTIAPVGPFRAFSSASTFTISTPDTSASTYIGQSTAGARQFQTFTTTSTAGSVASVAVWLSKNGTPTDNVLCDIYATDGSGLPIGASLGTATPLAATSVTGSAASYTFTFSTPVPVTVSKQYAAVFSRSGALDANATRIHSAFTNVNSAEFSGTYSSATTIWSPGGVDNRITVNFNGAPADAYYFFGRDASTGTTLQAFKSTNPALAGFVTTLSATSNSSPIGGSTTIDERYSQSFTTVAAVSLKSVIISLRKSNTPTDNVVGDIFAADGNGLPTGSSLGQCAPIAAAPLTTTYVPTTLTWATPIALSAATQYCLVLTRTGTLSQTNIVHWGGQSTSSYAGGVCGYYQNGVWAVGTVGAGKSVELTLEAYDAVPTGWTSISTKTGFTTAVQFLSACQVGNVIHMVVTDGATTSINHKYQTFDMSSDTFVTAETINSGLNTQTSGSVVQYNTSIVVRSTGEVVVLTNVARISTFSQISYRRRTGVATWAAAVAVSATGANCTNPIVVLGASDRLHFLWFNNSNTQQRHLTSANVLGTAASTGATGIVLDVATRNDAGTIRFVGHTSTSAFRWNSADDPTVTNVALTSGTPIRAADANGVFYALYQNSGDSDLYVKYSSDNGATWSAAVLAMTGTVATPDINLSRNQMIYTRGMVVFPYIVNDNATWKYNEVAIPTADAWNSLDKTSAALSNADKTLMGTGTGAVRSTQAWANQTAGKYYAEFKADVRASVSAGVGLHDKSQAVTSFTAVVEVFLQSAIVRINGSPSGVTIGTSVVVGDVVGMAWDAAAERIWFRLNNGLWNNDAAADPATGTNGLDISAVFGAVNCALWGRCLAADVLTVRTELADLTLQGPSGFTTWMGEALPLYPVTGTGALVAGVADLDAVGTVPATGTGALVCDVADLDAVGTVSGGPVLESLVQKNGGTVLTNASIVTSLPAATTAGNTILIFAQGAGTITTPSGFTPRSSQAA